MEYEAKFYQTIEFLETKRRLDRVAMSPRIWDSLKTYAAARTAEGAPWPQRVLDCGCGTGGMLHHLLEREVPFEEYHGIDIHPDLLDYAKKKLQRGEFAKCPRPPEFHALSVYDLTDPSIHPAGLTVGDMLKARFDLVCALSLAEHVNIEEMLGNIWNVLAPDGLVMLPINYDGDTIFAPALERFPEEKITWNFNALAIGGQVYEGSVGGNSYCGRTLYHSLDEHGFEVLALDAEDWVISPRGGSIEYDAHAKRFVELVIRAIAEANRTAHLKRQCLCQSSVMGGQVTKEEHRIIDEWMKTRLAQLGSDKLVFICHQMGALARRIDVNIRVERA